MRVYNVLDYPTDDGIRDPFRWARFAGPWMLAGGLLLVLGVMVASGKSPEGEARRAGFDTAQWVRETAQHLTEVTVSP